MAPKTTATALKGIHQSIKANRFDQAKEQAKSLLEKEPRNYQAHVFLAFALNKTGDLQDAEAYYEAATALKKDDYQAWAGLTRLYETQGPARIPEYRTAVENLCRIYSTGEDRSPDKAQDVLDKFVDFARTDGSRDQYVDALGLLLPDGPLYELLEGRLPHPARTLETMAQILESEEKKRINTLIGERRTRIGANINDVTTNVKREVYARSRLEGVYRQLINWTTDDELRHAYEDKLLVYCYERLACSPAPEKAAEATKVRVLAEGMVIIKRPFKLAWDITIDWKDEKEIGGWDVNILREYCSFFPDSDLYKVLTGFLTSQISPFPQKAPEMPASPMPSDSDSEDSDGGGGAPTEVVPVTEEDRLSMMLDGVYTANSIFAYRLLGEYYQHLEEHESNVELMRRALGFLRSESGKTGLGFGNSKDAINLSLATSLVFHQSPRHHDEAKSIFDDILSRDPLSTPAMIGVGLIYEEEEEFEAAIGFLERALARDDTNLRVRSEAAWVKALNGDYETAAAELEICIACIRDAGAPKQHNKDLLALSQYRLGVCIWELDPSDKARKRRKAGAYPMFVEALKSDFQLAPAYTMLGIYFEDYAKDKKRARKCFQQAVELSPSEVDAAKRLARSFADEGSWEHVELIARRVVDSGKVKPPPGSKRKGISWPHAALGVAELNKHDFAKSVVSFQAALRTAPDNYPAWIGLGEAYASSGRFVAATKAILQAQSLQDGQNLRDEDVWFTRYMLANVKREIGEYDESIDLYRQVLSPRPTEEGVVTALLQTLVESGHDSLGRGMYGKSIDLAVEAIKFAVSATYTVATTFNYWKAVGDACSIFSRVQDRLSDFPVKELKLLIQAGGEAYSILQDVDGVDPGVVNAEGIFPDEETAGVALTRCLHGSILAHKMAIHVSQGDSHAQAVAYFNLGWAEYRAHICLPRKLRKTSSKYLRASSRCFKRAIELEAGNADFWNAFGVTTCRTHPTVSQHAFVRSLHIDERSPVAWTNLGTLALLQGDDQLAYEAFIRAQSTDPDYSPAWVGQGYVSMVRGKPQEARVLFTHAMSISDASFLPARRQYSASLFDFIMSSNSEVDIATLTLPVFALSQLKNLDPHDQPFVHLGALFQERVGDTGRATSQLQVLHDDLRADYEMTKVPETLDRLILSGMDLARVELASESYDVAIKHAKAVMDLVETEGSGKLANAQIEKARLSGHLTIGLACYHLGNPDAAVNYLETALNESENNADAACLLAQILWAMGTESARDRARDVLFGIIEEQPEHVPSVLLLGGIAVLDDDAETQEAVSETLLALRTSDAAATLSLRRRVAEVLEALAECREGGTTNAALVEAQAEAILYPNLPHGWEGIRRHMAANPKGAQSPANDGIQRVVDMAVRVALRAIPPKGQLAAEDLSAAFCDIGSGAGAQRAIMTAPWMATGWQVLGDCI